MFASFTRSNSAPVLSRHLQPDEAPDTSKGTHGPIAGKAETSTHQVLDALPKGALRECLTPAFLDTVHAMSYLRDDRFESWPGRCSPTYLAAWLRGKHCVAPRQRREGIALGPEAHYLLALTPREVGRIRDAGGAFLGIPFGTAETDTGLDRLLLGKTMFRPAPGIAADLATLCDQVRLQLQCHAQDQDPQTAAWIAADFMRDFIAIHPYMDGNGRVSRCIAQRILREFDLPPPNWRDVRIQLHTSLPQAAALLLQAPPAPSTPSRTTVSTRSAPQVPQLTYALTGHPSLNTPSTSRSASVYSTASEWSGPASPGSMTLSQTLAAPLPQGDAQAQQEALLRLREVAMQWRSLSGGARLEAARALTTPQFVQQMGRMNAEWRQERPLKVPPGAPESARHRQSRIKTEANLWFIRLLNGLVAGETLSGGRVLDALIATPPGHADQPSYLQTVVSQARWGSADVAASLCDLLRTLAPRMTAATTAQLRQGLLNDGALENLLGVDGTDVRGRLLGDRRYRDLTVAAAELAVQLQALGALPDARVLRASFGKARAQRYERGMEKAKALLRATPLVHDSTPPIEVVVLKLQAVIQHETLAMTTGRKPALKP